MSRVGRWPAGVACYRCVAEIASHQRDDHVSRLVEHVDVWLSGVGLRGEVRIGRAVIGSTEGNTLQIIAFQEQRDARQRSRMTV